MNDQTEYEVELGLSIFGFANECPASREAVAKGEYFPGEGCPLCGDGALMHEPEETP